MTSIQETTSGALVKSDRAGRTRYTKTSLGSVRSSRQKWIDSASKAELPVWHVSFKGVVDLVCASHESFREHAGKPIKKRAAMKQLIELCASKLIDIRPFRSEPRVVKRKPKNHPLLNAARHEYIEICHRSRYRLNA